MAHSYSLINGPAGTPTMVQRDDGVFIPADPGNIDWQAYEAWLAAGNAATPAPAPAAPPPTCALWQLQSVMTAAQWSEVTAAVTALGNPAVSAFFQHGTNVIPANSTTLVAIAAALGLTPAQVTALVAEASAVSIP